MLVEQEGEHRVLDLRVLDIGSDEIALAMRRVVTGHGSWYLLCLRRPACV